MVAATRTMGRLTTDGCTFAQDAEPLLQRLDPGVRAMALATLAGLIILGCALMLLAWLGSRATRRYMNSGDRESRRPLDDDDWSKKPLHRE